MTAGFSATQANTFISGLGKYIKLHTGDPGSAGTANAAAGSTTRVLATMNAASGGAQTLSSMASSWTNGGTSETLSHISGWTASTAGTFDWSAALSSSQAWASTNTFSLTSLSLSITPIAA